MTIFKLLRFVMRLSAQDSVSDINLIRNILCFTFHCWTLSLLKSYQITLELLYTTEIKILLN